MIRDLSISGSLISYKQRQTEVLALHYQLSNITKTNRSLSQKPTTYH